MHTSKSSRSKFDGKENETWETGKLDQHLPPFPWRGLTWGQTQPVKHGDFSSWRSSQLSPCDPLLSPPSQASLSGANTHAQHIQTPKSNEQENGCLRSDRHLSDTKKATASIQQKTPRTRKFIRKNGQLSAKTKRKGKKEER
jgi:hypothetical protein